MVPTSWQDEALARHGVSREEPCSALKCETGPDSVHATPKSSPIRRVPSSATPRVPAPLHLSPFSPPDRDRRVDSPAWSGRGSRTCRRTSRGGRSHEDIRTSHVGGATCLTSPIPRSALEKNPMTNPSSRATLWVKAKPEAELTPPCIIRKHPRVPHTARRGACGPLNNSRGKRGSLPQTRRGLTLLSQLCRDPAVGVRNAEEA